MFFTSSAKCSIPTPILNLSEPGAISPVIRGFRIIFAHSEKSRQKSNQHFVIRNAIGVENTGKERIARISKTGH